VFPRDPIKSFRIIGKPADARNFIAPATGRLARFGVIP